MPAAAAQEIHGYFCTNEVLTGVEAPAYIDPHTRAVLPLAAPGFTLGFSRSQIVRKFASGESLFCTAIGRKPGGQTMRLLIVFFDK